jgi:AraC-like DNA-binding protein
VVAPDLGNLAVGDALPARRCGLHELARDRAFRVEDCVCDLGAAAPPTERTYERAAIGVMLGGTFVTRASQGEAVVGPGALLLKSAGTSQQYKHVDDGGDRSVVFEYDPGVLDDAERSFAQRRTARAGRRTFDALVIPPSAQTAAAVALAEHALCTGDAAALQDAAMAVAAAALAADWGQARRIAEPTWAQAGRVARAMRYVDAHLAGDCGLDALAEVAGLSAFHFARLFRAVTGQTPRQHVIAARLRAAAIALRTTRAPVTEVALASGFGDLSHFTTTFRRAFGVSPGRYRRS